MRKNYIMKHNKYLTENLLPMIDEIMAKKTESYTLNALGLERYSSQSILISMGIVCENFWNKVISDSKSENLIEKNDLVKVNNKNRQVDHNFRSSIDGVNYYLESKCNLNFDSEKSKASNSKIREVQEALDADVGAYFVPVIAEADSKTLVKYRSKGIEVYGVKWLMSKIDTAFSEEEYFSFFRNVIGPLLEKKGL